MSLLLFNQARSLFLKSIRISSRKNFSISSIIAKDETKPAHTVDNSKNIKDENAMHKFNYVSSNHKVNDFERRILVWTGKFKSTQDVPAHVTQDTMERARNKARIKIANYMMAITAFCCLMMVFSGKRALERGESVQKMNLDWHKQINASPDK